MSDAVLRFVGQDVGLSAQFKRANQYLDDLAKDANKATAVIAKGFVAVGAAVAAVGFTRLTNELINYAEELQISSAKTGIAIENLQRLKFVAGQADVEFGSLTNAINRFQVNMTEAGDKVVKAARGIGIEFDELRDLAPDEQFARIASRISAIEDPAKRTAAAVGIFGKSGADLLPVLVQVGSQLQAAEVQLDQIGGPVSAAAIGAVDDIGDSFGRLKIASANLGVELLSNLGPILVETADGIGQFVAGLRIAAGGGGDALVNLDRQIQALQQRRDQIARSIVQGPEFESLPLLDRQIAELTEKYNRLLNIGAAGAAAFRERNAEIDAQLTPVEISVKRNPTLFEDTPEGRREAHFDQDPPLVIEALKEKDLILQINQEKIDELTRQQADYIDKQKFVETDLAVFRRATRELYGLQEITFEEGKNARILDLGIELFSVLARENSKFAKVQQALAIVTIIYDTARAVTKAFAEVPYPLNFGVAALIAAQGAIQIAKIRSTNYGGGGGGGGSVASAGGGSAASTANTPAPNSITQPGADQGRVIEITVNGMVTEAAARELMDIVGTMTEKGFVFINQGSTQAQIIREGT